ncbi:transcription elongation factor GreA [Benzoatithermus flavus]|uniref:Transcription elongation factor GreA n=1 Tax=Benzoatithermus flavus TaxID=3108223 RepID=A0ABU8XTX3_9PROT
MSRAFVREDDQAGVTALPDRPISPHPNLVTRRGLALIERNVAAFRQQLAAATAAEDQEAMARAARELRYWAARHATAELTEPPADTETVVFGTAVTGVLPDGTQVTYRIVGEDEADPSEGRIAWTAPVARLLLGSSVGDVRRIPAGELEIVAIDPTPEPPP